ncbi:hypothetical protein E7Z57_08775 [Ralstonia pseudosolanacearum]|uniref:Uncharacterized protein n=1 Tax=Ralstonia solanacearum TaxID=305 RepID=A0A0S4TME0_RALSL|nr:hypothetical protein E7Z57_08775 [Ralstonia pseudosolanacearum]CUV11113.1 conserved protein of unknown function [Ralstonia solanacearum]
MASTSASLRSRVVSGAEVPGDITGAMGWLTAQRTGLPSASRTSIVYDGPTMAGVHATALHADIASTHPIRRPMAPLRAASAL